MAQLKMCTPGRGTQSTPGQPYLRLGIQEISNLRPPEARQDAVQYGTDIGTSVWCLLSFIEGHLEARLIHFGPLL